MPGHSILVVDDSPTILKLVQLELTKAGYRVATASGGEAGLMAAKEDPPALILLDFLLPDLNGDDVCAAMSADSVLSTIPVVVMSAKGQELESRFAHFASVVDFLTKPFSPDTLRMVVAHSMQKGAPAAELTLADLPVLEADDDASARPIPHPNGAPVDAALAGDLAVIAVADVLGLLRDQVQTGLLTLARGSMRLEIFLQDGRIALARAVGVPEEFLLGRFLVTTGNLAPDTLEKVIGERTRATQEAKARTLPLLGADLVARALVTEAGLRQAMTLQTSALVFEALRWGEGRFWFRAIALLPTEVEDAALALDVEPLLMEGFRRVDQWRLIEREIGDFDRVFLRDEERLSAFGLGRLTREEGAILDLVNGRNSVKDIVLQSKLGSFDVTKMLYRLLRTKLIRRRVAPLAVSA